MQGTKETGNNEIPLKCYFPVGFARPKLGNTEISDKCCSPVKYARPRQVLFKCLFQKPIMLNDILLVQAPVHFKVNYIRHACIKQVSTWKQLRLKRLPCKHFYIRKAVFEETWVEKSTSIFCWGGFALGQRPPAYQWIVSPAIRCLPTAASLTAIVIVAFVCSQAVSVSPKKNNDVWFVMQVQYELKFSWTNY